IAQSKSVGSEGDKLQQLVDSWGDVVDQINARSPALASFFRNQDNVRPVAVSGSTCTIAFRHQFHAKQTMTNEPGKPRRAVIEAALRKVLGYKCILESTTFEEAGSGGSSGNNTSPTADNKRSPVKEKPTPYET